MPVGAGAQQSPVVGGREPAFVQGHHTVGEGTAVDPLAVDQDHGPVLGPQVGQGLRDGSGGRRAEPEKRLVED